MNDFSERFKILRNKHKLTQEKLAEELGMSKSAISMYENGNREPDFETLELIADYFNVDINYLLGRSFIENMFKSRRVATSQLAEMMLEEGFIELLAKTKNTSLFRIKKEVERILTFDYIAFFDLDIAEFDLINCIKEEMLSNTEPLENNIAKVYLQKIYESVNSGFSRDKYNFLTLIEHYKDFKQYTNIIRQLTSANEDYMKADKELNEALGRMSSEVSDYYLNEETRKIAQEIFDNPELKILFDASRKAKPEDLRFVVEMFKRMKKDENHE